MPPPPRDSQEDPEGARILLSFLVDRLSASRRSEPTDELSAMEAILGEESFNCQFLQHEHLQLHFMSSSNWISITISTLLTRTRTLQRMILASNCSSRSQTTIHHKTQLLDSVYWLNIWAHSASMKPYWNRSGRPSKASLPNSLSCTTESRMRERSSPSSIGPVIRIDGAKKPPQRRK
ncbi:eIF2 kinase Gcn2p negative regulator [Puccinia graminis f. sp. tritici]|uniref:eIF2 kinase Gcn2p negative regulator n=1 Tax=Puccinia graminis f. sp. tritici TaxID=56615 RepID=A0A5B0MGA8_PUCGR|nr:eIF2 kinase Gcn2p negative regulator [Puccinia graminis f. sp. tritici]